MICPTLPLSCQPCLHCQRTARARVRCAAGCEPPSLQRLWCAHMRGGGGGGGGVARSVTLGASWGTPWPWNPNRVSRRVWRLACKHNFEIQVLQRRSAVHGMQQACKVGRESLSAHIKCQDVDLQGPLHVCSTTAKCM